MIGGIGNDIIEIGRIQKAIERNANFIHKHFTLKEQAYFQTRNHAPETIAGNFAAKEAVSKALGTGFRGFGPSDIEVIRNEAGAPIVCLYAGAKELAKAKGISTIWVSISHCKAYATAYAIAEIACK